MIPTVLPTIKQTRGDTRGYRFTRKDANGQTITAVPKALYFTVKSSFRTPGFIFQKTIEDMTQDENGAWHFRVEPEDTNNLCYGEYVYDVEVIHAGIKTTISKGKFVVTEESTWAINEGNQ